MYDNIFSVILVTAAFHSSYGTYLMSSVFSTFPRELIEAAVIDGCGKLQLLFRIIVPISKPALSVLFVFFFIWTWNDFFLPLIFLISNANRLCPLRLRWLRVSIIRSLRRKALRVARYCALYYFLCALSADTGAWHYGGKSKVIGVKGHEYPSKLECSLQGGNDMKFDQGHWRLLPGTQASYPMTIVDVQKDDHSLTITGFTTRFKIGGIIFMGQSSQRDFRRLCQMLFGCN